MLLCLSEERHGCIERYSTLAARGRWDQTRYHRKTSPSGAYDKDFGGRKAIEPVLERLTDIDFSDPTIPCQTIVVSWLMK